MDILKYRDYEGTAEIDISRLVCRGKVLFIDDLVTYEAASPADLQKEFEAAVDDYLQTCSELNRPPQKPLKGQFNVRVSPYLHKAASLRAMADKVSLNDVVVRALEAFVIETKDINHNIKVVVDNPEQSMEILTATASFSTPQWIIPGNARH